MLTASNLSSISWKEDGEGKKSCRSWIHSYCASVGERMYILEMISLTRLFTEYFVHQVFNKDSRYCLIDVRAVWNHSPNSRIYYSLKS